MLGRNVTVVLIDRVCQLEIRTIRFPAITGKITKGFHAGKTPEIKS